MIFVVPELHSRWYLDVFGCTVGLTLFGISEISGINGRISLFGFVLGTYFLCTPCVWYLKFGNVSKTSSTAVLPI